MRVGGFQNDVFQPRDTSVGELGKKKDEQPKTRVLILTVPPSGWLVLTESLGPFWTMKAVTT